MTYIPPPRSDGTIQQQRIPQGWPEGRPSRILSIDGGGICGILPAAILAELERRYLGGRCHRGIFRPASWYVDRRHNIARARLWPFRRGHSDGVHGARR